MKQNNVHKSTVLHKGRTLTIAVDTVELPNGRVRDLEVVRHPGAAAIVPINSHGEILFIRQYRYAAGGDYLLEVPAGKIDPGETPEACAFRETEEEVGFKPGRLIPMGWIWTTPGFSDERIWLYLALDLQPSQQELDADEILSVVSIPLDEAVMQAKTGAMFDAKTVCAVLRTSHFLAHVKNF